MENGKEEKPPAPTVPSGVSVCVWTAGHLSPPSFPSPFLLPFFPCWQLGGGFPLGSATEEEQEIGGGGGRPPAAELVIFAHKLFKIGQEEGGRGNEAKGYYTPV